MERLVDVTTPLGTALWFRQMTGTEAISTLSAFRVKMEQYYQDNRSYVGAFAAGTVAPKPVDTTNWLYTCNPAPAANAYTIVANGAGTMAGFQYSVDQANTRITVMTPPSTWPGNAGCWVLKQDGSC